MTQSEILILSLLMGQRASEMGYILYMICRTSLNGCGEGFGKKI